MANEKKIGFLTFSADGKTVIKCNPKATGKVVIPNDVVKIKDKAFWMCEALTDIVIPESVSEIGEYAFAGCEALTSITIPESVAKIGSFAFTYCRALTSITLPTSVIYVNKGAFAGCNNLTDVFAGPYTRFSDDAFMNVPNEALFRKRQTFYAVLATVKDSKLGDWDVANNTLNTLFADKKSAIAAAKQLYSELLNKFRLEDNGVSEHLIPGGCFTEYDHEQENRACANACIYDSFEDGRVSQRASITVMPLYSSEPIIKKEK